jgi:hypothetical protein
MPDTLRLYNLHVERRDKYLYAAVTAAPDGLHAAVPYIEAVTQHFIRDACSCVLIENQLDLPFALWDAVAVAPRLGNHLDGCIKLAIVETGSEPTGQRELKIQIGSHNVMTVRVFDTAAEAEAWFDIEDE